MGQDNYPDGWREDEDHWLSGRRSDLGAPQCGPSLTHHYATNCFAQQRWKTRHFHLPPYRFQEKPQVDLPIPPRLAQPPVVVTRCSHCGLPCHGLLWSELEFIYKTLGEKGIHMESFTERLNALIKRTAIGERLDQSARHLQNLIDYFEASTSNLTETPPYCSCILKRPTNTTSLSFSSTSSGPSFLYQLL